MLESNKKYMKVWFCNILVESMYFYSLTVGVLGSLLTDFCLAKALSIGTLVAWLFAKMTRNRKIDIPLRVNVVFLVLCLYPYIAMLITYVRLLWLMSYQSYLLNPNNLASESICQFDISCWKCQQSSDWNSSFKYYRHNFIFIAFFKRISCFFRNFQHTFLKGHLQ